jgi:hypothetical protein
MKIVYRYLLYCTCDKKKYVPVKLCKSVKIKIISVMFYEKYVTFIVNYGILLI